MWVWVYVGVCIWCVSAAIPVAGGGRDGYVSLCVGVCCCDMCGCGCGWGGAGAVVRSSPPPAHDACGGFTSSSLPAPTHTHSHTHNQHTHNQHTPTHPRRADGHGVAQRGGRQRRQDGRPPRRVSPSIYIYIYSLPTTTTTTDDNALLLFCCTPRMLDMAWEAHS